jgi:hypothetical protein
MMMTMPTLVDQHRKLAAMIGSWAGEETIHPTPWDPKGGTTKGRFTARAELDGFTVVSDYVQERDGAVCYRGHGVYGWDPNEQCFTMHWFDTMGGGVGSKASGQWQGTSVTFAQSSPMGHSRYVYTFPADGTCQFRIEMSEDGKSWAPFLVANYRKQ